MVSNHTRDEIREIAEALFSYGSIYYATSKLFGFYLTGNGIALNLSKQCSLMTETVSEVALDGSWTRVG